MTCAACAATIERALNKLPGVRAEASFARERVHLEYDSRQSTLSTIVERLGKAGFSVQPAVALLDVTGMSCSACASRIENVLNKVDGVQANVNFAASRVRVEYIPGLVSVQDLTGRIRKCGFGASEAHDLGVAEIEEQENRENKEWDRQRWTLIGAILLTLPLFVQMFSMFSWASLSVAGVGMNHGDELPRWLQWALATAVQFWAGRRFYRAAWNAVRGGSANMDVLVVLGTSSAYLYSAVVTLLDLHDHVYFEASATIVTLILFGRLMEARARRKTSSAIRALLQLRPKTARVERDGLLIEVDAGSLLIGDIFVVAAGESVPVDGNVISGVSSVDEAMLSGESLPVTKERGSRIHAGTINQMGALRARATGVGSDTLLAQIIRMVDEAQGSKAPIQKLADRISSVFVPVVLAIAILTLSVTWLITGTFSTALVHAVAVLVIACPCSLGLATPTAIMVGTGLSARAGILIRNAEILERAQSLRMLVVDKTGTVTQGRPEVTDLFTVSPANERDLLRWAAAVETGSAHPLSRAIIQKAQAEGIEDLPVTDFVAVPGRGVSGRVGGRSVLLGSSSWIHQQLGSADAADRWSEVSKRAEAAQEQGKALVGVAVDGIPAGYIAIADRVRDTSREAIQKLKSMGVDVVMLTGDNRHTAQAIAQLVGITRFAAEVLPQDKAAEVNRLKSEYGEGVGMVGDGINDAPALAAADVSFAIGAGSDIAIESADVVLVHGDLLAVAASIELSSATVRKIHQNLFFAFFFNALGIPAAAAGLLNPVIAGAAMAMSSVLVVSNSLLLNRWRPKKR